MTSKEQRTDRRTSIASFSERQSGVVSVSQVLSLGISRSAMRAELAAGRWQRRGSRTLAVDPFIQTAQTAWWFAVLESGRQSALDGVSALAYAGMTGYDECEVHVSVPRFDHRRDVAGVRIHNINRRLDKELVGGHLPCVKPAIATIRAATWAGTDRQAALIMVLPVQQRLFTGGQLIEAAQTVGTRERRDFIRRTASDIGDGAHSLGELDFGALCRDHGVPAPERQSMQRGPNGRIYLDVRWPCGLVVEIDGVQHHQGMGPVDDALRQNHVTLSSDRVLRIPLLGLRMYPEQFLSQVKSGLQTLGAAA